MPSAVFVARSGASAQGGQTLTAHAGTQVGMSQVLLVATHATVTPGTPTGWTSAAFYTTAHSRITIFTRALTAGNLSSSIVLTYADFGRAELRTYATDGFTILGHGAGLVSSAETVPVNTLLLRVDASAQANTSNEGIKTFTPDAALVHSTGATQHNWYDGLIAGDDPISGGTAPARTATLSGGGSNYPQWVDILVGTSTLAYTPPAIPSVTGTLDATMSSPTMSLTGTVATPPPPPPPPPTTGNYSAQVLNDQPLAYYRLDEASGTAMVDYAGSHNGVYMGDTLPTLGALTLVTDDDGHGVAFDGNNAGEVTYGSWMSQPIFSVEILFRPDSLNGTCTLASRHDSATGSTWTLRTEAANLVFYLHADGWESIVAPTPLEVGVAHHVVGTYDGTTMRLYVDGKLVNSALLDGALDQTTARLRIGASAAGGFVSPTTGATAVVEAFDGVLDEFAFYNSVLTPARVTAHASTAGYLGAKPVAAFTMIVDGLTVDVDASASHDPDGGVITAYEWDTDDAGTSDGRLTDFTFAAGGSHRIGLTVIDEDGNRSARLDQYVDLTGGTQYVTLVGTEGTFEVNFATAGSATAQFVPDFAGSLVLQPTTPQSWQAAYVVTDADGDDVQDDSGVLSLVWDAHEAMSIAITPVAGQPLEPVTFTWSYAARASSPLSISMDEDEVRETPGGLKIDIYNGQPSDTVTLSVFGPTTVADFQTAHLDTFGVRENLMVRLPALDAGAYFLRVEGDVSGSEDTPFTVLEDALSQADPIRLDDAAPPRNPTLRWRLFDLRDHDINYTFVRNPSSWTNVYPPNDFTHDKTTAPDGQPLTWQAASRPWRMEFTGWLDTEAEYNDLLFWSQLRRRLWLIDHRNRAWLITIEQFDAQAQVKPNLPWAHKYTVKTLVFMQG